MITNKMEFQIENYRLRATEDGKIERFWKANQFKPDRWKELKAGNNGNDYLYVNLHLPSRNRNFSVHRLVYLAHNPDWDIYDAKQEIDHDDGNRTNNKIENLKLVNCQQNHFNYTKAKGYSYNKKTKKFEARIGIDGKKIALGCHDTKEQAHQAYLDAKPIYHII